MKSFYRVKTAMDKQIPEKNLKFHLMLICKNFLFVLLAFSKTLCPNVCLIKLSSRLWKDTTRALDVFEWPLRQRWILSKHSLEVEHRLLLVIDLSKVQWTRKLQKVRLCRQQLQFHKIKSIFIRKTFLTRHGKALKTTNQFLLPSAPCAGCLNSPCIKIWSANR